ncbi:MAG: hypothetical protein L6407_06480, partial [Candidatus Delongbacteria bacterium]|nr:hypothetical protein [Candidatus Delongbacteria bacterium]
MKNCLIILLMLVSVLRAFTNYTYQYKDVSTLRQSWSLCDAIKYKICNSGSYTVKFNQAAIREGIHLDIKNVLSQINLESNTNIYPVINSEIISTNVIDDDEYETGNADDQRLIYIRYIEGGEYDRASVGLYLDKDNDKLFDRFRITIYKGLNDYIQSTDLGLPELAQDALKLT